MTTVTTDQLREAVNEMDSMSQSAFGEIAVFAKLALRLLEAPRSRESAEALVCLLQSVWGRAKDAQNDINCMAEGVGCNYVDEVATARIETWRHDNEPASIGRA